VLIVKRWATKSGLNPVPNRSSSPGASRSSSLPTFRTRPPHPHGSLLWTGCPRGPLGCPIAPEMDPPRSAPTAFAVKGAAEKVELPNTAEGDLISYLHNHPSCVSLRRGFTGRLPSCQPRSRMQRLEYAVPDSDQGTRGTGCHRGSMTRRTFAEMLASRLLARDGIEAIWRLHVAATREYRNRRWETATALIVLADAAEREWAARGAVGCIFRRSDKR